MTCRSAMALRAHPLIAALHELALDPNDFVIFGSGPLLAHGLRDDVADLDVVARGRAWWQALGHPNRIMTAGPYCGKPMLHFFGGSIEISPRWVGGDWDIAALIDHADTIDGLRFASLRQVLTYKRALRRPKDGNDIAALELYLFGQHPSFTGPPVSLQPQ